MEMKSFIHTIKPLLPSVSYIIYAPLAKILISILEGIIKKFPMRIATISR